MITESSIEACIENLENNPETESRLPLEFEDYLQTEIYPNLTDEERQILSFCLSVIHNSAEMDFKGEFDLESYLEQEEMNWAMRDKDRSLDDSMNNFFDSYKEEDLLAFVEDMVIEDEDQKISIAGKEIIVIVSKSYIDLI